MSQYLRAKATKISNVRKDVFDEALKRMGFYADFNVKTAANGETYAADGDNSCDCALFNAEDNTPAGIGFIFEEDADDSLTATSVSDWGYGTRYSAKLFNGEFTREYKAAEAIAVAESQGFHVVEDVLEENGQRRLALVRAA